MRQFTDVMRLRKEISKWSFKTFLKWFGGTFLFLNVFFALAGYVDYKDPFHNREFLYQWLTMGLFYPLLLSAITATASRSSTITLGDFQTITNFREKLMSIATEGFAIVKDEPELTELKPASWFYKTFYSWTRSENITIRWGIEEVVIHGSQRKVSTLEDSLTWNKMFKA